MAGLKAIKSKIRSIEKTETVTKAMEAVSAAKMRRAQQAALAGRAYAKAAVSILARVSGTQYLKNHPLATWREINRALYVVITSDKGLAGSLNSAVLRAVQADLTSRGLGVEQVRIVAVGRKAQDYFQNRGYTIEAYHPNWRARPRAQCAHGRDEVGQRQSGRDAAR
jgi:F-type H+-transporting ATPase subunit gamma